MVGVQHDLDVVGIVEGHRLCVTRAMLAPI
jgi:hypothetical protein